jgi:hypothetical protein
MKKLSKNKTSIAFALFLMFAMTSSLVALPTANAHDPPYVYQTYTKIHVAPNPVGVGEQVEIVSLQNWAIPGALYNNDIRQKNIDFTITKPDGNTEKTHFDLAPDPGGSAFILYTPDQTGTYTVKVDYGKTVFTWTPETESTLTTNASYGDIWLASSATTTFTVQEEPVGHQTAFPLPTEYWTRPIDGANYLWANISSNWLGGAAAGGASISTGIGTGSRWQPDGSAPRTPHIMWTKPIELGGITGGYSVSPEHGTPSNPLAFYSGMSYETRFNNPIIIGGILFYPQPLGHSGSGGGYVAVDLRTGQEIWRRDDISPSKGQLPEFNSGNQHGVVGGILWQTPFFGSGPWVGIDAFTGKNAFNLTGVPNGYEVYDTRERVDIVGSTALETAVHLSVSASGDITRYVINYNTTSNTGWLGLWSVAKAIEKPTFLNLDGTEWRGNGMTIDTSDAYIWNVTLPDLSGSTSPQIVGVIPGDILVGTSSNVALTYLPRTTQDDPWTMWAISLKPDSRGALLWKKDYAAPPGNITRMLTMVPVDPVNRVWTMTDFDTGQHHGYSIDDGKLLWSTVSNPTEIDPALRPMQGYSVREGVMAYGILYVSGYGGEVLAYATNNGTLLWKFNDTSTTLYTSGIPWGLQPLHVGAIADGIVYAFAGEHSPGTPLYTGYRMFALNAFTGEKIWDLFGWSSSGLGTSIAPVAIADGYLAYYNCYDGQVYSIGKGPSATSVTASPKVSVNGDSVLVEGTVVDTAAGTKQAEQAARFPNGVPAVSDDSMSAWMEHVYMQKPKPSDAVGVNVTVSVLDPNNNVYEVGKTTSDSSGSFKLMFTPQVPGEYTVIASFAGSDSYFGSSAETHIGVNAAPVATAPPTPPPASLADIYLLPATIGIIVAIAVVGAILVLMLRKR